MGYLLKVSLLLILIAAPLYYFRADFSAFKARAERDLFFRPCVEPLGYTVAAVDGRFGLSEVEFAAEIAEAERIWEDASGRDLFAPAADGSLAISLVYDYRQDATEKLGAIDDTLASGMGEYENLKTDYQDSAGEYRRRADELGVRIESYNADAAAYEREVRRYNREGGAPADVFASMTARREELEGRLASIRSEQAVIDRLAEETNRIAGVLNDLATEYNLNAEKYNDIGGTLPAEYEQGNFTGGLDGGEITIYQFDNHEKLVRVLAHELGHALGLDHLGDPEDIMYSLNIGENKEITEADLAALEAVCSVPNGWEKILGEVKRTMFNAKNIMRNLF